MLIAELARVCIDIEKVKDLKKCSEWKVEQEALRPDIYCLEYNVTEVTAQLFVRIYNKTCHILCNHLGIIYLASFNIFAV